ncbi:GntR family transcriptional regulator (plasmid) [Streptomyces sp. NBC_00513]|uniref:GntR family transcriptional regulator n=1 Tax=unclassified Streptomyces TaxID=2593676 RepID=UPI0022575E6C|nr:MULTISPECIES: GntR family transcriptional regulator [unclassified Streptomyces]MCX5078808.1 GntR family transcriptional regulator [Streptomyces sp. NBC_00424]WUD46272.1 GntR family transcriptional regulator [Streptomyces sp. NBC_00513]
MPTHEQWRDLADRLAARIDDGEWLPGMKMPTNATLIAQGEQKSTVDRAYRDLVERGYVIRRPRHGTVVRDRTPVRVSLSRYRGVLHPDSPKGPWQAATAEQGLDGRMQAISVDRTTAPRPVSEALGILEGAPVVRRIRHASIGKEVVQVQTAWYEASLAADLGLDTPDTIAGGIFGAMERGGLSPRWANVRVTARLPMRDEATILAVGKAVPLLLIQRVTRDSAHRPVEVLQVVGAADRLELIYDDLPLGEESL